MGYRIVRWLARFLLSLFYRQIEVLGSEHIPSSGPLILAANHQNALVDPMLLLATVPRRLVPIAKAPLFRHPLIAPFLYLVGAVPAHRRQEAGSESDPARNEAMFRAAIARLSAGGAMLIFPEGLSHALPSLMPLRTGTARILLGAEAATGRRVTLLPVGLVFHEPGTFRAGWALVLVGKPVPTEDCAEEYSSAPEAAVRRLTERLGEALRQHVVEAGDRQTLRLVRLVETLWREELPESRRDHAARVARMQEVVRAYWYLAQHEPGRLAELRRRVEAYARDLELAGLSDGKLPESYPPGLVFRYALREGLSLLLGSPLALWGVAMHLVPSQLTAAIGRGVRPPPDAEATVKLAVAFVLYPLCWIAEGCVAWWLGGGWGLGVFTVSLLPTGFLALAWRERWTRVRRDARGFFRFLMSRDLRQRRLTRRRELVDELAALARLVPESVRSREADDG